MESLQDAKDLISRNFDQGIEAMRNLLTMDFGEDNARVKEQAILTLGEHLAQAGKAQELAALLQEIRPLFSTFPKAKTAKIVKALIDSSTLIPDSVNLQIQICEQSILWCKEEKRTFLKQRIETRLAQLYMENNMHKQAIDLLEVLLKEVKKLDDKLQLVEIQLIESKVYHKLENIPRSKASLTAARSCANAIYCPPVIQADIDMMSGILNCEEKDYRTGFSYFYEAYEGFNSIEEPRALHALKYMLLSKIMSNRPNEVQALVNTKGGLKYTGRHIEGMRAVGSALDSRSLHAFQKALDEYPAELTNDEIVSRHLQVLYNTMLEQHLIRIIEPFSKVELVHVAKLIELPEDSVTNKLSEMILDQKFHGTLDQGSGCLIVYDEPEPAGLYSTSLKYIEYLGQAVDSLFELAIQTKGN